MPFRQTQSLVRLQDAPSRFEDQAPADHSRKLFSGDGQFAGIINNHIRQPALLSQWPLASFAPIQFVLRPAAMLQHAGQPDGSRTVNQYHPAAKVSPASFQQNCGIQQDHPAAGLTPGRVNTGLNSSPDFRMHNPFQLPAGGQELGSISKNLSSQCLAVNLPLIAENLVTKSLAQLLLDLGRQQDLVADGVCIQHRHGVSLGDPPHD